MKQITLHIILFFVMLFPSCNDWLNVDKLGSMTDKEVFEKEDNINAALNSIYMDMAGGSLYGGHLTLTTIELLSHYYYYPSEDPGSQADKANKIEEYYNVANYKYEQDEVKDRFSSVWEKGYNLIFSLNVFIQGVKETDAITEEKKNLLLGEAYGLRAFLHFDLFRLFGPVYLIDVSAPSIPYNDKSFVDSNLPYIPANEFIDKVLADIKIAKTFLADDPILTFGLNDVQYSNLTAQEVFSQTYRNRRFNYHAACALEARVLLYKGDFVQAGLRAQEVIDNTQNNENLPLFGFEDPVTAINKNNYIFYNEVIFGIQNVNLGSTWDSYMRSNMAGKVYSVDEKNLANNIFLSNDFAGDNDYRIRQWKSAIDLVESEKRFSYKYKMTTLESTDKIKNHQPLIRISEMYYILAEVNLQQGNTIGAAQAIAKVQGSRGIQKAHIEYASEDRTAEFLEELLIREYYKEFFGEGQIFFFHKRKNREVIFNGYGTGTSKMVPENYVIPLPTSETDL